MQSDIIFRNLYLYVGTWVKNSRVKKTTWHFYQFVFVSIPLKRFLSFFLSISFLSFFLSIFYLFMTLHLKIKGYCEIWHHKAYIRVSSRKFQVICESSWVFSQVWWQLDAVVNFNAEYFHILSKRWYSLRKRKLI